MKSFQGHSQDAHSMLELLRSWYKDHFSDPQVVILALILMIGLAMVLLIGDIVAPLFVAMIFAYLLDSVVNQLQKMSVPRLGAVILVMIMALLISLLMFFGLVPLLTEQIKQLVKELPQMIGRGQDYLLHLPTAYPEVFSEKQIQDLIDGLHGEVGNIGQTILKGTGAIAKNVITFGVYIFLVPILVFFMLKDKQQILDWMRQFAPSENSLSHQVWIEVDSKIGSYVRGKFIEIGIVWIVTYATFVFMGLQYALLLSFLVGLSVIIPYIGAIAVTIPVALIALFQWGATAQCFYLLLAYQVIQLLDGNILVPILFSEAVKLHPVAIIVAVVFFGGIWGVWGIFFSIPLATLVQAILKALQIQAKPHDTPTQSQTQEEESVS